jgi:hypothetical protein
MNSFFPPEYIKEVGTFQDSGALENDPLPSALLEHLALFPKLKAPDFVISLGTGEPAQTNYDVSTKDRRNRRKYKMFQRIKDLFMERMRERTVRKVYKRIVGRSHSTEPRLDNTEVIPELIAKVEADKSLSKSINNAADCLIASLFYFELDSMPEWRDGRYLLNGRILCSIRRNDTAFHGLLTKMAQIPAKFWINDGEIAKWVSDVPEKDQNFCIRIQMETSDEFTVSIRHICGTEYSISGSPFSVKSLVEAQGLHAHFGRADHGKRKRSRLDRDSQHRMKRQRIALHNRERTVPVIPQLDGWRFHSRKCYHQWDFGSRALSRTLQSINI